MRLDRRAVLTGTAALMTVSVLPKSFASAAINDSVARWLAQILGPRGEEPTFDSTEHSFDDILSGQPIEEGGIALDVPNVAENGAQVPITIHVDSPMTEDDHVTAIHIVATRNPTPGIGTFRLTPALARAEVTTRIRLAEGQEILVLAELSDGRVRRVAAEIAVTLGGCAT